MNRILFRGAELDAAGRLCVEDRRAAHLLDVLKARPGQVVRLGLVNGPRGRGTVEAIAGRRVTLRWEPDGEPPSVPPVDLLLALPRPKVLRRLWAPLAALGVGRIVLVNAARVERQYFDTHWLQPAAYEPLLLEGLEQAGDTRLPEVAVRRRFRPFVEDELESLWPATLRVSAEPGAPGSMTALRRKPGERMLVAVGPEGGWTEFELRLLDARGFRRVGLGERTLRSDTACIALLALAHEVARRDGTGEVP